MKLKVDVIVGLTCAVKRSASVDLDALERPAAVHRLLD
jgi:hypothetical protein